MKTIVKQSAMKEGIKNDTQKFNESNNSTQIKPDFPLSEKDEVKAAEEKMRTTANKKRLL